VIITSIPGLPDAGPDEGDEAQNARNPQELSPVLHGDARVPHAA
jgi:hypothetical protein